MANITPIMQCQGARSFSAGVVTASASDVVQNADLQALCDGGRLLQMMQGTYATAADLLTALGQEGNVAIATNLVGSNVKLAWDVDGGGSPILIVTSGGAGEKATVRIALWWSAAG